MVECSFKSFLKKCNNINKKSITKEQKKKIPMNHEFLRWWSSQNSRMVFEGYLLVFKLNEYFNLKLLSLPKWKRGNKRNTSANSHEKGTFL